MKTVVTLLLWTLLMQPAAARELLPPEFVDADPRVQLYMAYAQFKMANHRMARLMWERIGGSGEAEAAFNLGIVYEQGLGVPADLQRAVDYYRKAAQGGSRAGAYQLGLMQFSHPALVAKSEARHWLSVAALDGDEDAAALLQQLLGPDQAADPLTELRLRLAAGETEAALAALQSLVDADPPAPRALTLLAWMYERGVGVGHDIERAGALFRQAAEAGDAEAQYALAVMLETGVGQPHDPEQAAIWLRRAAERGYQPARRAIDRQ
ncbi:tetratricopeptide repeat protein [Motiliproteus sediminis]|uniref:tetratricopeptide repeat protein n=1 Tax=Motiliproteus sediminis TaxID=1468178 RepID=UPI001AF01891|nr:tetratricopeptide repeat protein [Motiliproteus sediminis]